MTTPVQFTSSPTSIEGEGEEPHGDRDLSLTTSDKMEQYFGDQEESQSIVQPVEHPVWIPLGVISAIIYPTEIREIEYFLGDLIEIVCPEVLCLVEVCRLLTERDSLIELVDPILYVIIPIVISSSNVELVQVVDHWNFPEEEEEDDDYDVTVRNDRNYFSW